MLLQTEYIAPEEIENIIIQSLLIGQSFVYGDSLQSSLVAIVVPDEEPLRNLLASSNGDLASLAKASLPEICQNEAIKEVIMKEIHKVAKKNGLHGFEIPKAICLSPDLFSVDNGLLTPTFKLKRQQARDNYAKEIERMYASMPKLKTKI